MASVVACAGSPGDGVATQSAASTVSSILPLEEVSALAKLGDRYAAVGDRTTAIVSFEMHHGRATNIAKHTPLPTAGQGGSQFEAAAFDGSGRLVVVAEQGKISIVSADLSREESSSMLDWPSAARMLGKELEENSLAEGMVLLDETHVLVTLEKHPTALVEFGPEGDEPRGFVPDHVLPTSFAPPARLEALKIWKVDDPHAEDLSELCIGPDGALWAVSQKSNTLVRFERVLRADESRATIKQHFDLPSNISGAEGLAFDGNTPIVARDRSSEAKNLYVLDPLDL